MARFKRVVSSVRESTSQLPDWLSLYVAGILQDAEWEEVSDSGSGPRRFAAELGFKLTPLPKNRTRMRPKRSSRESASCLGEYLPAR